MNAWTQPLTAIWQVSNTQCTLSAFGVAYPHLHDCQIGTSGCDHRAAIDTNRLPVWCNWWLKLHKQGTHSQASGVSAHPKGILIWALVKKCAQSENVVYLVSKNSMGVGGWHPWHQWLWNTNCKILSGYLGEPWLEPGWSECLKYSLHQWFKDIYTKVSGSIVSIKCYGKSWSFGYVCVSVIITFAGGYLLQNIVRFQWGNYRGW